MVPKEAYSFWERFVQRSKKLFTFLKGESKVFAGCPPVQNDDCCQAKLGQIGRCKASSCQNDGSNNAVVLAPVEASHLLRDKNVMTGGKLRYSRMRSTGFVPDTVHVLYSGPSSYWLNLVTCPIFSLVRKCCLSSHW